MAQPSLEFYSSLVRNIEGECSFLRISGDFLVAGSNSGQVGCWSISSGSEFWRVEFEGPCSNSDSFGEVLYFTESNKIHSIDINSGEVLWSVELQGSSDFVRCTSEYLWVTSSVYNFEIQDYSEGAVWKLGLDGTVIQSWKTEGRAWALSSVEGRALLGLSRPNCGYATVSELSDIKYVSLENENPVTVGNDDGDQRVFLGHSKGGVTEICSGESTSLSMADSSVSAIEFNGGLVAGLESGEVFVGEGFGSWSTDIGGSVETVSIGPSLDGENGIWASTWSNEAKLTMIELSSGNVKLDVSHPSRISSVCSSGKTICFGDSSGLIFILEQEVLRRRFSQSDEESDKGKERLAMREKIRGLRRG